MDNHNSRERSRTLVWWNHYGAPLEKAFDLRIISFLCFSSSVSESQVAFTISQTQGGTSSRSRVRKSSASTLAGNGDNTNLRDLVDANKDDHILGHILLPSHEGYVAYEQYLTLRLHGSLHIDTVHDWTRVGQRVDGDHDLESHDLSSICSKAMGAVSVRVKSIDRLHLQIGRMLEDLVARLPVSWLLPHPVQEKDLLVVEGGYNLDFRRNVFTAAKRLGIQLSIVDRSEHWLQQDSTAHLRSRFLAIDMTRDAGLAKRLVEACSSLKDSIAGMTTFSDKYLVVTAIAATKLNLPTENSESLLKCVDKSKTRFAGETDTCRLLSLPTDPDSWSPEEEDTQGLPLIVKPLQGAGSAGVSKVNTFQELRTAVQTLWRKGHRDVLVEDFVDGPEIDANFIMINDDVVFLEVADDFPKSAETDFFGPPRSFVETGMVTPSGLPPVEISLIKQRLLDKLLQLGFHNGVFHVEARVRGSQFRFSQTDRNTVDLVSNSNQTEPAIFVIEVNGRAPGAGWGDVTSRVYGVDYAAVQMLLAVGDEERARILAIPVRECAQHWSMLAFIPARHGGIFQSPDPLVTLKATEPELMRSVSDARCYFRKGDHVPDPMSGRHVWLAQFVMSSYISRQDAVDAAYSLRRSLEMLLIVEPQ